MVKKTLSQRADEARQIAWYKWEFLRRNPGYRRDYETFIQEFGSWFGEHGYWYDQTIEPWSTDDFHYFMTVIAPRAKIICQRWEIRDPISPDWKFTQSGLFYYKPGHELMLPTDCRREDVERMWDFSERLMSADELVKTLPESTATRGPDYHLHLQFDLRSPLPHLLRQAKNWIGPSKRAYDRRHPQPTKLAPAVRRRLDRYDSYLKAWDLKKSGKTFVAIGKLLFPGELTSPQRAMDSFKRAKELINGGYKELR